MDILLPIWRYSRRTDQPRWVGLVRYPTAQSFVWARYAAFHCLSISQPYSAGFGGHVALPLPLSLTQPYRILVDSFWWKWFGSDGDRHQQVLQRFAPARRTRNQPGSGRDMPLGGMAPIEKPRPLHWTAFQPTVWAPTWFWCTAMLCFHRS